MDEIKNAQNERRAGRYALIILALDKSGSMAGKQSLVYKTVVSYLNMMARQNETSLDFEYQVLLLTFDSDVHVVNHGETPMAPEQLLEVFEERDYQCSGGTSLAAVFRKMDALFSRKPGSLLENAQKGDAAPTVIYISDIVPTDRQTDYDAAKNRMLDNRYYQATKRLCMFLGPDSKLASAAELVGGEENVLAMEGGSLDLEELLLPVLWNSSIMLSDGTHIGGEQTNGEMAREQKERAELGRESAENLKSTTDPKELMNELARLFGEAGGGV